MKKRHLAHEKRRVPAFFRHGVADRCAYRRQGGLIEGAGPDDSFAEREFTVVSFVNSSYTCSTNVGSTSQEAAVLRASCSFPIRPSLTVPLPVSVRRGRWCALTYAGKRCLPGKVDQVANRIGAIADDLKASRIEGLQARAGPLDEKRAEYESGRRPTRSRSSAMARRRSTILKSASSILRYGLQIGEGDHYSKANRGWQAVAPSMGQVWLGSLKPAFAAQTSIKPGSRRRLTKGGRNIRRRTDAREMLNNKARRSAEGLFQDHHSPDQALLRPSGLVVRHFALAAAPPFVNRRLSLSMPLRLR